MGTTIVARREVDIVVIAIFCVLILALILFIFLTFKLLTQKAKLEAELTNERKTSEEKLKLLQDSEARLKTEFENLANRIFEEKGRVISNENQQKISGILDPFKTQLDSFRQRIDAVHNEDTQQSTKLIEQVQHLQSLSNQVSVDANNLALAIKGEAKTQGDWGEVIVERIFEVSGLERGIEYDKQVSLHDENGKLKKPDFIVYLPGNKALIVDSKVSLTAYERYCSECGDDVKAIALAEHLDSVHKHINELNVKNYSHLLGNRTLDFVIMCIPLEPAYQTAFKSDDNLLYDIAKTNIVITGPTTLMITLKLIAQIWRREHENQNAEVIADKAGKIYDQVARIVESMTEAKKKLIGVSDSFDEALKRLTSGRGNLVGKVVEIQRLGAKVSKQLPESVVAESSSEEQENNL